MNEVSVEGTPAPEVGLQLVEHEPTPLIARSLPAQDLNMGDLMVVAKNPAEMAHAQAELIVWAATAVERARASVAEHAANFEAAKKSKIRLAPWKRFVAEAERKVTYYEKILAALREGYFIVPDFPITTIAIRTDVMSVPHGTYPNTWKHREKLDNVSAKELPQGEGRYVGPERDVEHWDETIHLTEGKTRTNELMRAVGFKEVEMPVRLVKPVILSELGRAMQSKIFDEVGILPSVNMSKGSKKPDPMLVGVIRCREGGKVKRVQFLLAWWLDTSTI